MPRYFFTLNDGLDDQDPEGDDLSDDRAALREAARVLADQLRLTIGELESTGRLSVRVWTTDAGRLALRLVVDDGQPISVS